MVKNILCNRNFYSATTAVLVILSIVIGAVAGETNKAKPNNDEKVTLQISTVVGAPNITLAFTLTNNRKNDLETTPVGINLSQIIVKKPNGEQVRMVAYATILKMGVVKPSESVTWKVDIEREFQAYDLTEPGLYRLHWGLIEWVTDKKKVEHKSNEILLLIEKEAKEQTLCAAFQ